jgi:hypothetical protein
MLGYIVLGGFQKTTFGGAGVSFGRRQDTGACLPACWRFLGECRVSGAGCQGGVYFFRVRFYAGWVSTTRPDRMRLLHARLPPGNQSPIV